MEIKEYQFKPAYLQGALEEELIRCQSYLDNAKSEVKRIESDIDDLQASIKKLQE